MARLAVETRARIITLQRLGYTLSMINDRLKEGVHMTLRSLQRLWAKFRSLHTVLDLPRSARCRLLTRGMLKSMDDYLRNDDELTARKLRAKLVEAYPDLPDVSLSTIKRYSTCCCIDITNAAFI